MKIIHHVLLWVLCAFLGTYVALNLQLRNSRRVEREQSEALEMETVRCRIAKEIHVPRRFIKVGKATVQAQ